MSNRVQVPLMKPNERQILFFLAFVQFTSLVDFMVVIPLGPTMIRELELSPTQFGAIVSSYTIAAGIVGFLGSGFLDKVSRRFGFVLLYSGFLLGTLWCGLASTFQLLLAGRVATGLFGGLLGGITMAIIGDVVPEERRGQATGYIMSSFALASVIGVPLSLYIGSRLGWNAPLLAIVFLGSPVLFIGIRVLRSVVHESVNDGPNMQRGSFEILSIRKHQIALGLTGTLLFGAFLFIPFVTPFLTSNVAILESQLPFIYVMGGVATLVAAPLLGKAADLFGKYTVYKSIVSISLLFIVGISFLPPISVYAVALVISVLMLLNSGRMVVAIALITDKIQPCFRAGFMSINTSVQHISTGLGAYIGGLIVHQQEGGRLEYFSVACVLGALLTLVSMLFARRLSRC